MDIEINFDSSAPTAHTKKKFKKRRAPLVGQALIAAKKKQEHFVKGGLVKPAPPKHRPTSSPAKVDEKASDVPAAASTPASAAAAAPPTPNESVPTKPVKRPRADSDGDAPQPPPKKPKVSAEPASSMGAENDAMEVEAEPEPKEKAEKKHKRIRQATRYEQVAKKVAPYEEILQRHKDEVPVKPAPKFPRPAQQSSDVFGQQTFPEMGLHPKLLKVLTDKEHLGLPKPTLIQSRSVPILIQKRDAFIRAETGSGKTLAYLIPIIQQLVQEVHLTRDEGTHVLVIAPTRELCLQIVEVLEKIARPFSWLVPGHITGGEKRKSEKARLRKGIPILVATPGRLLDHLRKTNSFKVEKLKWLVLDEADRLLDLGFEKEVRAIVEILNERVKEERHSVLVSATLTQGVNRLMLLSLNNPVEVNDDRGEAMEEVQQEEVTAPRKSKNLDSDESSGSDDEAEEDHMEVEATMTAGEEFSQYKIPKALQQHYVLVPAKRRLVVLAAFMRWRAITQENCKMIVFVSTTDIVDFVYAIYSAMQFPTSPPTLTKKDEGIEMKPMIPIPFFKLHGNLSQTARTATFNAFRDSNSAILICTDVAARGLDLPRVNWIVQYDLPSDPSTYVHRIGRTARIGQAGEALLFAMPSEKEYVDILLSQTQMQLNELSQETIMRTLKTNFEANPQKNTEVEYGALQFRLQMLVEKDKELDLKSMAIKAFQSYVRSYATHTKSTRHIFHVKNLHLGHVSKSFALKEVPSDMTKILNIREQKKKREDERGGYGEGGFLKPLKSNFVASNEFDSGV